MADQPSPPKNKDNQSFKIPEPRVEKFEVSVADAISLADAAQEVRAYDLKIRAALTRPWWDWIQTHVLKWVLFGFVLGINIWWTNNVIKMVWQSGSRGNYFHLDNNVVIVLVTTSIANFLALVIIVAKNLFPGSSK